MAIVIRLSPIRAIARLRYSEQEAQHLKRLIMRRHGLGILTDEETTVLIHLYNLKAA